MTAIQIKIKEVPYRDIPMSLLLEADPSIANINSYLSRSICFAALSGTKILAVCVVLTQENMSYELMNIAVVPDYQQKGIGRELLSSVLISLCGMKASKVIVCTGTFGYQLAFYQRAGFRAISVKRDYFLTHYDEPIVEMGIQHKDMLMLEIDCETRFI